MTISGPTRDQTVSPTLHQRILADFRDRILSGEWPPGFRIPFEHELTAQYGCSRMTVSKALTQLANVGLIDRRRKAGSFVRRPHAQSAVLEIHDIKAEVTSLDLPYRFEITARRKRRATQSDCERLNLEERGYVLAIACCHYAGCGPFCLEERLINLSAVPDASDESFDELSPGAWLVSRVPWTTAEHRIRATGATQATANLLAVNEGTPCLVVERRTWIAHRGITFVTLTYPGDSHELVARFTPSQD